MMRIPGLLSAVLLTFAPAIAVGQTINEILEGAPEDAWVTIPMDRVLVMDLPSGPMYIEMRPDMAPAHIERITQLTREGFYDGVLFHRVIEGFMAQGGDPTGTGQGGSTLPDLPGEFARDALVSAGFNIIGRDDRAAQVGFVGTVPIGTQAPTLPGFLQTEGYAIWGLHCRGVMSMARTSDPNSANSQFFVMFGDSRDGLDQGYTVWGKIVNGYRNARRINRGEPPVRPTPIVRMRLLSEMPAEEQVMIEHLATDTDEFMQYLRTTRAITEDGFVDDMCSVDVPVRINGEIQL